MSPDSSVRCLLDLDADLAEELDLEARRVARAAATAMTLDTGPGKLLLSEWLAHAATGAGLLVVDGVMALQVGVYDRIAAELVGTGDLLQPLSYEIDQLVSCDVCWRALVPMRFAVLDESFCNRVRFWPQLTVALLRRAGRRARNLNVQRAIAAQPRLEVRLALLLWHLAGRWGKVEPGGIRLRVPLTHQVLGQLVAAERPSVSHALARLAQMGLVTGTGDEWHLHSRLDHRLPTLIDSGADRAEHIAAAVASFRGRGAHNMSARARA